MCSKFFRLNPFLANREMLTLKNTNSQLRRERKKKSTHTTLKQNNRNYTFQVGKQAVTQEISPTSPLQREELSALCASAQQYTWVSGPRLPIQNVYLKIKQIKQTYNLKFLNAILTDIALQMYCLPNTNTKGSKWQKDRPIKLPNAKNNCILQH